MKDLRWTRRDSLDVVQAIRWYCEAYGERNRAYLPQKRHYDRAKEILGLWLQPAYNDGTQDHLREKNWKDNLVRAGIDPETRQLTDIEKLDAELKRLEQRDYEEHIVKVDGCRRTNIAKLKKEYSDAQPKLPETREQLLAQAAITNKIHKLGRNEYGELQRNPLPHQASCVQRYLPEPEVYVPDTYGTPIPDENPSAKPAKPNVDQSKRGWWRRRS